MTAMTIARAHRTSDASPPSRIPAFSSVEEEAAFWDTHDSTEFDDEFSPADDVRFVRAGPKKAITIQLEPETFAALTAAARQRGIGVATLARLWLTEHLDESRRR
jgi:hypothetical protein